MFPPSIAAPQGCDIQIFTGMTGATGSRNYSWNKPVGVNHVYMMLIGGGGTGDASNGGGSGAVTVWYGAAQHVPDSLVVSPSRSGATSTVGYRGATLVNLLSANGGGTPTAATANAATAFAATGFYNSTAGQAGGNGFDPGPSPTTFLGGGMRAQTILTGNYGYATSGVRGQGFFQMQPIIVGVGSGSADVGGAGLAGGIGCGGGGNNGGTQFPGGPGMVLIASW